MSLRLAPVLVALSMLQLATPVFASEDDWLSFPEEFRKAGHAVDLRALKFRPDGLLESGERYPRTADESTGVQLQRGYNYHARLIDCETGFYIDTGNALLDKSGARAASVAPDPNAFVAHLARQLGKRDHAKWPRLHDIFISCAAASNSIVQDLRKQRAARVQPVFQEAPAILGNQTDVEKLLKLVVDALRC